MLDARVQALLNLPDSIVLEKGEQKTIDFQLPFNATIQDPSIDVLMFNGESLAQSDQINLDQPITMESVGSGEVRLSVNALGIFTIKEVTIKVDSAKRLVVGGQSVGVTLFTEGALVVGTSDIIDEYGNTCNPAEQADIKPGDVIIKADGKEIENASNLSQIINSLKKESIELCIDRAGKSIVRQVNAVKDSNDGKYRLGIWVRDSTAGVGTLTFYDPSTGNFGSLGHAITDVDTNTNLSIKEGELFESMVLDVKQGVSGSPGELKGSFDNSPSNMIGKLFSNTDYGIFGKMYEPIENSIYPDSLPIATRDEVKTGKATIVTTVDDTGLKEFDCEIIRVNRQNQPEVKSMVIKITDEDLLERTGGVVQGMSGSPIIQDGKIVGALTHVFVNDPTQGYGIYIEWMLEQTK